jgi:bifunctional non-homologous end joining protein LigD
MAVQSQNPPRRTRASKARRAQPASVRNASAPPGLNSLPRAAPDFVDPMKARLREKLPTDEGWLFDLKLDGIRAIAIKDGKRVRLCSRLPRDITAEHAEIVGALERLPAKQAVLDGEIVALDEHGRSSFQLLQNRRRDLHNPAPILYYAFDLLNLEGRDLKSLPLTRRKALLEQLLAEVSAPVRCLHSLDADAETVWKEITRLGLEGAIAKRADSRYQPGQRSDAWLKVKAQNEQEFVIGGYTPPQGSRKHFGSVAVGYYDGDELMFASKVGTGFDFATLKSLFKLFQNYRANDCPFVNLPTVRRGRYGQGITAAEMKRCAWLKPELVCQVRFMEWTRDGNLRHPVFLGLREDKDPRKVVREVPRG